jgi:hypothetical protein
MINLGETKTTEVKYLLGAYNHTEVYNKICRSVIESEHLHFAKPELQGQNVMWTSEISSDKKVKKFADLLEAEKEIALEELENSKNNIEKKFRNGNDEVLKKIINHIFSVPSENALKAVWVNGNWQVLLTQWACIYHNDDKGGDTVDILLKRPRSNSDNVSLNFFDVNDLIVPNFTFSYYLNYNKTEGKGTSSIDGIYNIGRCRIDSNFTISAEINSKKHELKTFNVIKDGYYKVIVPQYQNITIKVLNHLKEPVFNEAFKVQHTNIESILTTNDEGIILLEDIEVGTLVQIIDDVSTSSLSFSVEKNIDYYELNVDRTKLLLAKIKVISSNQTPVSGFKLKIKREDLINQMTTDDLGIITIENCKAGEVINAINLKNENNFIECKISETSNEFILTLVDEPEQKVKIKFVDHKDIPLINTTVIFTIKNKNVEVKTDNNGYCFFNANEFADKEKIIMKIKTESKKSKNSA